MYAVDVVNDVRKVVEVVDEDVMKYYSSLKTEVVVVHENVDVLENEDWKVLVMTYHPFFSYRVVVVHVKDDDILWNPVVVEVHFAVVVTAGVDDVNAHDEVVVAHHLNSM